MKSDLLLAAEIIDLNLHPAQPYWSQELQKAIADLHGAVEWSREAPEGYYGPLLEAGVKISSELSPPQRGWSLQMRGAINSLHRAVQKGLEIREGREAA